MAAMAVNRPGVAGAAPGLAAVSASDTFVNDGRCLLHVKNGGVGSTNVTIDDVGTPNPGSATSFNPDVVVAVPAGEERVIGPFPTARFNTSGGLVTVSYSVTTTVTAAVYGV